MSYYPKKIPQLVQDHCTKHAPHCVGCWINCKAPTNDADFPQWVAGVIRAVEQMYDGETK